MKHIHPFSPVPSQKKENATLGIRTQLGRGDIFLFFRYLARCLILISLPPPFPNARGLNVRFLAGSSSSPTLSFFFPLWEVEGFGFRLSDRALATFDVH